MLVAHAGILHAGATRAPDSQPRRVDGAELVAPAAAHVRIHADEPLVCADEGKVVFVAHEHGEQHHVAFGRRRRASPWQGPSSSLPKKCATHADEEEDWEAEEVAEEA